MAKGQQRDPKREAFWRRILAKFGKSGLSIRAFCRQEKVTEPAFYAWRRVIQERDAERAQSGGPKRTLAPRRKPQREPAAFVPVVLRDAPGPHVEAGIAVELRGGRVFRLPTMIAAERLAELVRAVEQVGAAMSLPAAEGRS